MTKFSVEKAYKAELYNKNHKWYRGKVLNTTEKIYLYHSYKLTGVVVSYNDGKNHDGFIINHSTDDVVFKGKEYYSLESAKRAIGKALVTRENKL